MASGAGLNRVGQNGGEQLLTVTPTATAYATPLVGYGTIGVNDSGAVFWEAIGFTKIALQLVGPGATSAGYSVTVYVTIDPSARLNGIPPLKGSTTLPATSWAIPPMQSSSGGGTESNPLVTGTNTFAVINAPVVAIRAVVTTVGTPAAAITVLAFAVP
jgi:hypothetical protein